MGLGRKMGGREGLCWRGHRYGEGEMVDEGGGEMILASLMRRVYTIQTGILYRARGYPHSLTIRYVLCRPISKKCIRP